MTPDTRLPASVEPPEPTWGQRFRAFFESLGGLIATRAAIFREELGSKAGSVGRAVVAFFIAATFAWLAFLLLTAGLAALLSSLFGSAILGILATFVLYAACAAIAGYLGMKAMSRVDFDFPVTGAELSKDWQALTRSAVPEPPPAEGNDPGAGGGPPRAPSDDLEARFRVGSE